MTDVYSFVVRLKSPYEEGLEIEARVVQAHVGESLQSTLERIYNDDLLGRRLSALLIIRLPVDEQWDPADFAASPSQRGERHLGDSPDARSKTFQRAREHSVHILSSGKGAIFVTGNLNPHWEECPFTTYSLDPGRVVGEIRDTEMHFLLDSSKALLSLPSGHLYQTPSRRLVKSFVRVGNIQSDRDAIDAIFFWLIPHLIDVVAILTDTWSISSTALNAARNAAHYFGGPAPRVEMLPVYPFDEEGGAVATQVSRGIVERLAKELATPEAPSEADTTPRQKVVLCLISATQSGRLVKHIEYLFGTAGSKLQPRFVSLFRLGPSVRDTLLNLEHDERFKLRNPEDVADTGNRHPIKIDPGVYFPLSFEDETVSIWAPDANVNRAFFEKYLGIGLIRVHRTHSETDERPVHHGIYLETSVLPDSPGFLDVFHTRLAALPTRPSLIVTPLHETGRRLGQRAAEFFGRTGADVPVFEHPNLSIPVEAYRPGESELRRLLRSAEAEDSILILDDVLISGSRLSQYQKYLRQERFKGRIHYLVGVARPESRKVWAYYQRLLEYRAAGLPRHTLDAVETVVLPNWHEAQCPWCVEQRLYGRWQKRGRLPTFVEDRLIKLLTSPAQGLQGDLFLQPPARTPFSLGPTSVFVGETANQAEVFAAIAAAIQHLRVNGDTAGKHLGPKRYPVSTVMTYEDYCQAKWTDSILRACMFRSADADELVYGMAEEEAKKTDRLNRLITHHTEGENEVVLEIMLAAVLEKCTIGSRQELEGPVKDILDPALADFLLDRLDEVRPRTSS